MLTSDLTQRIERTLLEHDETREASIGVIDRNGVITLSGTAPNSEVRQLAGKIVGEQEGVVSIINDITVEGTERLDAFIPPTRLGKI